MTLQIEEGHGGTMQFLRKQTPAKFFNGGDRSGPHTHI